VHGPGTGNLDGIHGLGHTLVRGAELALDVLRQGDHEGRVLTETISELGASAGQVFGGCRTELVPGGVGSEEVHL
jgi:hypothetical protein